MRLKESQENIVMLIVKILTVRTGSVVNLIVIMLSIAIPSVIMVSVAMPSVVAPGLDGCVTVGRILRIETDANVIKLFLSAIDAETK
jgi:hypothetical protein